MMNDSYIDVINEQVKNKSLELMIDDIFSARYKGSPPLKELAAKLVQHYPNGHPNVDGLISYLSESDSLNSYEVSILLSYIQDFRNHANRVVVIE